MVLEDPLGAFIVKEAKKSFNVYREQPNLITEHARLEQDTAQGGYAHRQLFELVQNSADALLDAPKGKRILICLTKGFLYCADDGTPIDKDGVKGLMFDRMSSKRNTAAIGRFGRGFKSVLRVTDAPEFYSRSGSFRFDKRRAAERIAKVAPADHYPVLRLPEPVDPEDAKKTDEELRELMSWATNIVRLPLRMGAHGELAQQIQGFPPMFLLFVAHVKKITLTDNSKKLNRVLELERDNDKYLLADKDTLANKDTINEWKLFECTHPLSSDARDDDNQRSGDGSDKKVRIQWAVPLNRLPDPGQFWAFFPTDTASLVAGILNAPWKTNEDRQNLLPGAYNEELIKAAAAMIAEALPELTTHDDPAQHLDALPRRHGGGDSKQVDLLRDLLFTNLHKCEIIPDQGRNLCVYNNLLYPPKELTSKLEPLERWAAYPDRPRNWLHHKALTRNRLATIDRLFPPKRKRSDYGSHDSEPAPRAPIAVWLRALVEGKEGDEAIRASMAAIQTAAAIPSEARSDEGLGDIVLTANSDWRSPDSERLFLPDNALNGDDPADPKSCVHPKLASDPDTLSALKKLGLKLPSPENRFNVVAKHILGSGAGQEASENLHQEFWTASRKLSVEDADAIVRGPKDQKGRELWPMKL